MSELINAPKAFMDEAPASWMSRVALSQGTTISELKYELGLQPGDDPDLIIIDRGIQERCESLGLDINGLQVALTIFRNFSSANLDRERFLLSHRRRAQYRYCPQCLKEQRTPYIPVHWRFSGWWCCFTHDCLMKERCVHCSNPIFLPTSMVHAGPKGKGIAYLSHCLTCGKALAATEVTKICELRDSGLDPWNEQVLKHGRATLAALYQGQVRLPFEKKPRTVRYLAQLDRLGLLPHKVTFLTEYM